MNIDDSKNFLENTPGLAQNLGMEFISTPEPEHCMARMKVDERNVQPFGYLSGGATLALAETLAGVGSCGVCPGCKPVGMNVNCNHVHAAAKGETVIATGKLIHKGKQTHVWQIDVKNEETDVLISTISVTNFIL